MPPTLQMCRQLGEINLASEQTMTLQMCKQLGETSLTNLVSGQTRRMTQVVDQVGIG